jgi:hypothetical protein
VVTPTKERKYMSLNYNFELDAEVEPIELLEILVKKSGFIPIGDGEITKNGVTATIRKHTRKRDVIYEDYGVDPKIYVWFWLNPDFKDVVLRNTTLARSISTLLLSVDGDAVVMFEDEVLMIRKNNRVVVIGSRGWLTPELDAAGIHYEQRDIIAPAA